MEQSRIEKTCTTDIQKLREEVFVLEQHVPVELEIEANEDQYIHCCIYKEDELIAYARVSLSHPVLIGRVCVKKKYRGLGYGRKVMKLAEEQITESSEIHLHAQYHAKGFYEALGYTCFGDIFLEAGIKHISMKKTIRFYDMNFLSMMTSLTPRTLRNYIKLGLLHGKLIKGKWQFTEENLESFFKEKFVEAEMIIKSKGLVFDYLNAYHPNVSCFVTYIEWNPQVNTKIQSILDIVNQTDDIRFYYFNPSSKDYGRLCVIAQSSIIKNIISILES